MPAWADIIPQKIALLIAMTENFVCLFVCHSAFAFYFALFHWADHSWVSSARSLESLAGLFGRMSCMICLRHTTKSVMSIDNSQDFVNTSTLAEASLLSVFRTRRLLTIFYLCNCTRP